MKIKLFFVVAVLCSLTACSKQHFYTINNDSMVLYYRNAEAKEVQFASSIDHFALHQAKKAEDSLWETSVPLHEKFTYFYIVDGAITLPDCTLTLLDDFGSKNCLYAQGL